MERTTKHTSWQSSAEELLTWNTLSPNELARYIDHTLLKADATAKEIEKLCIEAREHHFCSVCVNGSWVSHAGHLLEESGVKVVAVAGFPLGAADSDVKRYETEVAIDNGAQEIDVVLNIARLKTGDDAYVLRELRDVAEAADERPVKVILETCLLTRDEKNPGLPARARFRRALHQDLHRFQHRRSNGR